MEALKLISLFILISSININTARADFMVAKAIVSILSEHFVKNSATVTVTSFGKSEKVLEKVLRNKIDSLSVKVSTYSTPQKIELKQPTLLLFDSFDSFVEWDKHLVYQVNRRVRLPHLIHIEGATLEDIKTLKWGFDGDSTNFLIREGKKSIALVTGFMFGASWCRVNQFAVINRFKSSTMKWEGSTFYPEKYRNFQGCSLNIARGPECSDFSHIYDILATALNFTMNPFDFSNIFEPKSDPKIDLFCDLTQSEENVDAVRAEMVSGTRYFSAELTLIVPYGELFTPLEKMFMPFYFEVWMAILATLLMALVVVQIINRCTQEIQNAFYGGNNSPTLSLAELFLCGAQRHRPRRSPARFILMMFIIWCLIIRTCYQSELFKCLQSDARKPGVKSVAKIIEQNLTLYGGNGMKDLLDIYTKAHGLTRVNWKDAMNADYDIVAEPGNKAVMVSSKQTMPHHLNRKLRSGAPSFVFLLDEVLWTVQFEFVYRSGVAFKTNFDRKTTQLLEGGFIARWLENYINDGKIEIKRKAEVIGPQVLTMDHLEIGFIVWLVPLALCLVVFVFEVGKRPCRELRQHVRGAIVARSVVLGFINHKHIKSLTTRARRVNPKQHKNFKLPKRLKLRRKQKIATEEPAQVKRGKQTQQNKKMKHKIIIVKSAEEQK